jgi:thioester reductase-like protein
MIFYLLGLFKHPLSKHSALKDVAVIAREDSSGNKRLVAYVIATNCNLSGGTDELTLQLRTFLQERLPECMIPSAFVFMNALPLSPSGKVDRRSLPAPNRDRPALKEDFIPPSTQVERQLSEIWSQILGIEPVGIHDNFFDLGGNSLQTIQLIFRVRETFQIELPIVSLFDAPTIAKFADFVNASICSSHTVTSDDTTISELEAEAALDPTIDPGSLPIEHMIEPENIFLTGATGFLGAFLLHELLEQTGANIYCLVRAANTQEASQRLQNNLERYSLWNQSRSKRIIPVVGDLTLPLLGFSSEQFQTLAETIDAIYHNGGLVNFIYPYSLLKAPNVLGTQEILRLASQTKVKPVHFVSSIDVFSPSAYPNGQIIHEQEANCPEGLFGYAQSKWVAEKLMVIARERRLPISIYRPSWIEGHSPTGVCNRYNFLYSLLKGCIQLGLVPDWNMQVDIVPVDYISRALVHLSRQKASCGKVFHLSNPKTISWNQLVDWMCASGYSLQKVSHQKWVTQVMHLVQRNPENVLYPFLTFLSEPIPGQHKSVPEIYFQTNLLRFGCQNTLNGLIDTGISCPPVDEKLLTTCFSHLTDSSFLIPKISSEIDHSLMALSQ